MVNKVLRIALPIVILSLGVFFTWVLLNQKKPPIKQAAPKIIPTVEVLETKTHDGAIQIESHATTEADAVYTIAAEVGGRVIWVNPSMKQGKKVKKGEKLFRIDSVEYELAVQQSKANLMTAQYDLDLVRAKQNAAIEEYNAYRKMNQGSKAMESLSPLAKYEPQVESAIGELKSAEAGLKKAELDLKRTTVAAPDSGYFRSVSVNKGQIIVSNETVAELVNIAPVVLNVSVPLADLQYITFEGDPINKASDAIISKNIGTVTHRWQGTVKRRMGEMDDTSRNAVIVVEIEKVISNHGLELPVGLFVDVTVEGRFAGNIVRIPQQTVRNDSTVWIVTAENKLEIRNIQIERYTNENAFISNGLESGEKLIVSSMTAPVQGMTVAIFGEKKPVQIVKNAHGAPNRNTGPSLGSENNGNGMPGQSETAKPERTHAIQ